MYLIQKLTFLGTIMCSDGMKNNKQQILVHKYVYTTCTSVSSASNKKKYVYGNKYLQKVQFIQIEHIYNNK